MVVIPATDRPNRALRGSGVSAKSRQEQGEDVTVSTTLGAVEDQMEETAKAKEEASS